MCIIRRGSRERLPMEEEIMMKDMKKQRLFSVLRLFVLGGCVFILACVNPVAAAVTVDFEDIDLAGQPFVNFGSTLSSQGYNLESLGAMFIIGDPAQCEGGCVDNGTQTLVSLDGDDIPPGGIGGGPITVTEANGKPFRFVGFDAAEGIQDNSDFPPAASLVVTGELAAGGTVAAVFNLDGDVDTFETFSTVGTLLENQLFTSILITAVGPAPLGDGAFALDNLVVESGQTTACANLANLSAFFATYGFTFDGALGEDVTVRMSTVGTSAAGLVKASVTMTGPDFTVIKRMSNVNDVLTVNLPQTGTYAVSARWYPGRTRVPGDYCLELQSSADAWTTFQRDAN